MADRFLDSIGLRHLWEKIKAWIPFLSRKTQSIPFGRVDSTSTATAFTAEIDGIDSLRSGVCCYLRNGVVPSESGYTLDINGLGAKPVYDNMHDSLRSTTEFDYGCTMLFVYNSDRVVGGCWDIYHPEGLLSSTNDFNDDFNDDFGYGDEIPDGQGVEYDAGNEITIDDDTISSGHVNINGRSGRYALHPFALMAFTSTDNQSRTWVMEPFTTTGGTNDKVQNSAVYPIGCQIYYHPDEIAYSADTDFVGKRFYATYDKVDARYSATSATTLYLSDSYRSSVFLRVIINYTGWSVYPENDEIIVTSDSLVAGNWYIYLGKTNGNDTHYTFQLERNHPLYYYDGSILVPYESYMTRDRYWKKDLPQQTIRHSGKISYGVMNDTDLKHLKQGLYKVTVQRNIYYNGSTPSYGYMTLSYTPDATGTPTYIKVCSSSFVVTSDMQPSYNTVVFCGFLSIEYPLNYPSILLQQEGPNGLVLGGNVPYGGQNAQTFENDFILLERIEET